MVPFSFSMPNYSREIHDFEHYFTIDYAENSPIKLITIEIRDRLYLASFSLIYLDTNEDITGKYNEITWL